MKEPNFINNLPFVIEGFDFSQCNYSNEGDACEKLILKMLDYVNSEDLRIGVIESKIKVNPGKQFVFPKCLLHVDYKNSDLKTKKNIGKLIMIMAYYYYRKYTNKISKVKDYSKIFDTEDIYNFIISNVFESYSKYNPALSIPFEIYVEQRILEIMTRLISQGVDEIERVINLKTLNTTLVVQEKDYYKLRKEGYVFDDVVSKRKTKSMEDLIYYDKNHRKKTKDIKNPDE